MSFIPSSHQASRTFVQVGGRMDSRVPDGAGYDFYPIIGQSNPIGRATARAGIDDDYSAIEGRVFQFGYNSQTVTAATNPLDHVDETAGTMGFWLEFCKAILPTMPANRNILLGPCCKGGTSYAEGDWNPGDPVNNNALSRIGSAMNQGSGLNVLKAVLWHQGESDADAGQPAADLYLTNIQAMYDHMLVNMAGMTASTPFIVGTINPAKARATTINASLQTFADNNPAVRFVSLSDLTWFDGNHFNAASLATMGARYAETLL